VGSLVHRVLELAGVRRLEADAGAEPLDDLADLGELLDILDAESQDAGPWVFKTAKDHLEAAAPFSFAEQHSAEQIIDRFPVGEGLTLGGIVDRVDRWQDEAGDEHVHVIDYKTGFIPPVDELAASEQANLYLAWAAEAFGVKDERLVMVFWWPGPDIKISIRYDSEAVDREVGRAVRDWQDWTAGGYTKAKAPPAELGVSCAHCAFRDQCEEYQDHVRKPARVHPWAGLEVPELVALRHQVAGDAKMLEAARKELDRHLMERLRESDGRFEDDAYSAKIQRDKMTGYALGVVEALAKASGETLEDVMRATCSVSGTKLKAFVKKHIDEAPRVAKVLDLYATPSMKAPYLRARAKGGMF